MNYFSYNKTSWEDKRTLLPIQWLGIKVLVLPKEINLSEISTKTQREDLGTALSQLPSRTIQFLTFLTFYCQKSSLGFKHFICFCVKSQFPLGDKVKVDKSRASSPMQAANLHTTVFKCGTWGFQSLAISRGERIFSACLQRSVFPSTILWEVPYLAGKNSYCSAKSRK